MSTPPGPLLRPASVPIRGRWLGALLGLILAGWIAVGVGVFRAEAERHRAAAARQPLTARATGTVVSLDSVAFSRGSFYYRARVVFGTPHGQRATVVTERKGHPPGRGGVWRPGLRVGGPVTVCFAPSDPRQNAADVYATAPPCPLHAASER